MARYCTVCGKKLVRSKGPIGPICLAKIRKRSSYRRTHKGKNSKKLKEQLGELFVIEDEEDGRK